MRELGIVLLKKRRELDLTLQEVADKCGVSISFICYIESGIVHEPKFTKLCKLLSFYSISIDEAWQIYQRG